MRQFGESSHGPLVEEHPWTRTVDEEYCGPSSMTCRRDADNAFVKGVSVAKPWAQPASDMGRGRHLPQTTKCRLTRLYDYDAYRTGVYDVEDGILVWMLGRHDAMTGNVLPSPLLIDMAETGWSRRVAYANIS